MLISEKIFELIKERNMTQKEFSKLTGIAEGTISDWKRKNLNPSAEKLPTICRALGVSPYVLLSMDEDDWIYSVSDDERYLIESFRKAENIEKKRLYAYAERINSQNGLMEYVAEDSEVYDSEYSNLLSKKILAKKLRKLARLDRIRLDENEHSSKMNLHLLKYLDYIGLDNLDFLKGYLSQIQPFMLEEIKSQEKFESAICVLDEFYRISVYIKVSAKKGEEIIVSFHENNKNGIAKRNSLIVRNSLVYVFADSIGSYVLGTNTYSINMFITRGVRTFPINIAATKYDEDGFLVRYEDINSALISIMNQYIEDLYTADLDYSEINKFSSLQELSFTSYGNDVFSNISILLDSLIIQKDMISKQIADAALCIYCSTVSLTKKDKEDLLDTLNSRFKVNSIKSLPEILKRIEVNLP